MVGGLETLTEDEKRALRGSKFAPLPSQPPRSQSRPRLSHPGGPLATNKAAALAKFLERKLQEPGGLDSINLDLLELAVKNAKDTVNGAVPNSGRRIRHVTSFDDSEDSGEKDGENQGKLIESKVKKHRKKRKKGGKQKDSAEDGENQDKGEGSDQNKPKKKKMKNKGQKMVQSSGKKKMGKKLKP